MKIKQLSGLAHFLLLKYKLHCLLRLILLVLQANSKLHKNLSRASRQSLFQEILGASLRIVLYSVSPYRQSKLDEGFLFLSRHSPSVHLSLRQV